MAKGFIMRCDLCKEGEMRPGAQTVTLERDGTILVIKDVPGEICGHCDNAYFHAEVVRRNLEMLDAAVMRGAEVEITTFPMKAVA